LKLPFRYILTFLLLAHCLLIQGQNYVRGKVNDESGKPVSFVSIKFAKDSVGIARSFCISDVNGKYLLTLGNIHDGWIIVSAVGYDEYKSNIHVNDIDTSVLNITLFASSKMLSGITIKNKPSIDISGDTTSYNADRFKRGNESSVGDLLKNIPGFTPGPGGTLIYNGKVIDKVLINGDDLTGANYSKLVSGLDVQGIEKLQVIQNYADGDNLLNSFGGGKEQVLNIAYKKGFLNKIFGILDGAQGIRPKYYNYGLQAMGLFDKVKILSINRINSVGKMNTNPGNSQLLEDIRIDPDNDIELNSRSPLANINDISTGIEGLSPFFKNNSISSQLNFLVRPAKKFTIRGSANYVNDKFDQQMTSVSQYFTQPFFEIRKSNEIARRLRKLEGLLSFNYFPDSKNQLHFTFKNSGNDNLSSANTRLSGNSNYSERIRGNNEQTGIKVVYNHLFRREAAFSFNVQYKSGASPGLYSVLPAAFQDFFNFSGFNDVFNQQEYQRQSSLFIQSKLIKKSGRHTFTLGAYWKKSMDQSINLIEVQSSQLNKWVANDSINNSKLRWNTTGVIAQDRWILTKKLSISFSSDFQYYSGELQNLFSGKREEKSKGFLFLPGADVAYKISKKSSLNFSITSSAKFSESYNSGYGYIVRDINSISKNINTLQMRRMKSASLFYSYLDLLGEKIVFLSGVSFFQSPLLTLGQIQSFQTYTVNEVFITNKKTENFNLFISGYKFYNGYRTQIIPIINVSKGTLYTVLQNKVSKINFNQVQMGIGYNTEVKNWQIKSNLQYTIKNQKVVKTITNNYLTAIFGVGSKIKKNLFADTDLKYYFLKSASENRSNFIDISAKFQYNSQNEKWQYGVTGTNLLNKTTYSTAMLSDVSSFNTSYKLFPRTILFFIKYKF